MVPDLPRILIVEDDAAVRATLTSVLRDSGFEVEGHDRGEGVVRLVREQSIRAVLLDVGLPGLDGLEVCRRIRAEPRGRGVAIVLLTGLVDESDEIRGFEAGADDFLVKPWRPLVLVARIRNVLQRTGGPFETGFVRCGPLELDSGSNGAWVGGEPIHLSPLEFRILSRMIRNPGRILSREELYGTSEPDPAQVQRTVDVRIAAIRSKLRHFGRMISTVWGRGYRLDEMA